jgi:catechol 2,3-dioxygenase-like lactoylglutathione lyase family enzyme
MLGACDIVAFLATTDLSRSRAFYADVLGLPLVSEDAYACTFDAHGTTLRVSLVEKMAVAPYTVLGWSVPDIDEAIHTLSATSVSFEGFDTMDHSASRVWTSPSGARMARFKDPDGSTLSVTENA